MSASDLFCSKEDWERKILRTQEWPTGSPVSVYSVPSLGRSIGISVGDQESPVVFQGYKVEPIQGNVALSVCLGNKWAPVVRRIHEKFVEEARSRVPKEALELVSFPSPLVDAEYTDLVLQDIRQPLKLLGGDGKSIEWSDLVAGDTVSATIHFGGFVSNKAVWQMSLACSKIQKIQ